MLYSPSRLDLHFRTLSYAIRMRHACGNMFSTPNTPRFIYWKVAKGHGAASGTTPAMKMYSNLPIYFQKGEISFGVGYEPSFADISYAFQVALRGANLSKRASSSPATQKGAQLTMVG